MEGDKAAYSEVPPEVQQSESPPRKSSPPPGFPSVYVFFVFFTCIFMVLI